MKKKQVQIMVFDIEWLVLISNLAKFKTYYGKTEKKKSQTTMECKNIGHNQQVIELTCFRYYTIIIIFTTKQSTLNLVSLHN